MHLPDLARCLADPAAAPGVADELRQALADADEEIKAATRRRQGLQKILEGLLEMFPYVVQVDGSEGPSLPEPVDVDIPDPPPGAVADPGRESAAAVDGRPPSAYRRVPRPAECKECGDPIEQSGVGRVRLYCRPCAKARLTDTARRKRAEGRGLDPNGYRCDQCPHIATRPETLRSHKRTVHRPGAEPAQRNCQVCTTTFVARRADQKYCSPECRHTAASDKHLARKKQGETAEHPRPCEQCGTEFTARHERARFCSSTCRNKAARARLDAAKPKATCPVCEKEFTVNKEGAQKYCSRHCKDADRGKQSTEIVDDGKHVCAECQRRFNALGTRQRYCTPKCHAAALAKGERGDPIPKTIDAELTFACDECPRRFQYAHELTHHHKVTHTASEPAPGLEQAHAAQTVPLREDETRADYQERLEQMVARAELGLSKAAS